MSEAEYAHITERLTELQMHALATSLAPAVLKDRQSELDDLKQFCRSNHQFAWFQAPPWAGKTALLASFFLNPPAGVIPVAFFTSRRMVGQSTSEDFLSAMVDQLACISGQPSNRAYRSSLEGEYQRLLRIVPEILSHNRLKLLMVVDGLDEDTGPSVGQPSIASRIPKKPAANLCVVATSRTHPGIPVDVDADHPLRKVSPRDLRVSDHAEALKPLVPAGLTMADMALRFILGEACVSTIIPGMRKLPHVEQNIATSDAGPLPESLHDQLKLHRWDREPTFWSQ